MALKTMMLKRSIEKKKDELAALIEQDGIFATREAELEQAINEAQTDEEETAVAEEVDKFEADKAAHEEAKTTLSAEIDGLENQLADEEAKSPTQRAAEPKPDTHKEMNKMPSYNNIRSLPDHVRAFDALPMEQRQAILATDEAKNFLANLRSMGGQTRAVTGADLTIPTVILDLIAENMYRYSKLLNRVRVRIVSGTARQVIAGTIPEAVWTENCGNINEINLGFNAVTLDGYKVAGFVSVCNSNLEDSDIDLMGYVVEALSEALGKAIDKAILYGLGSARNMPMGIVTRLAQTEQPAGYPVNAPTWVNLSTTNVQQIAANLTGAEFWSALTLATGATANPYARGRQFWAMNSRTLAMLKAKAITFTATGSIRADVSDVLPIVDGDIEVLEFMTDGDIVGGYGDLYLWAQRAGMSIEASRDAQFIQDNTVFRGKSRADGVPVIAQGFVAININGTAPTTTMTFPTDTANAG